MTQVARGALRLALLLLVGCGGSPEGVAPGPGGAAEARTQSDGQPVLLGPQDVAIVERTDLSSGVVITGSLDPYRVVDIKAQVAGTISDLRVDRGQPIERGAVLAVIQAEGVRSQASGAKAKVAAAEANLAAAQRRFEGARRLYEAGAMSAVDFRTARAEYEAAEAQLAAAKAELAGASESARRATVTAPIEGVVSARAVSEGEAVTSGQQLLTIVNSEILELSGQIPVQQAARVRVGQPVTFTLDSYPGQEFTGKVARIDPVADPSTRRVGAALQLPNPEGRIVGGQYVTGEIITANIGEALVVPDAAVRGDEREPFVLAVENGHIVRRPVELGLRDARRGRVAIQSGLEEGAMVIVSPATDLEPGTSVRVAESVRANEEAA